MKKFKATCSDGFTKTVMAADKESAVMMLMADPDVQQHARDQHPELAGKTPEEMQQMMASMTEEQME